MIRIFLPLICAALGFAAASCSQSEGPFAPAEAPASPHPTSHDAASAAMANPPSSPPANAASQPAPAADRAASSASPPADTPSDQAPPVDEPSPASDPQASSPESVPEARPDQPTSTRAERRASTLIGMPVVSADGGPLGEVKDIIFDRQGRATHLVIAYGAQPEAAPGDIPDDGKPASSPDGKLTAMPWDAAAASIRNDRLVLDGAQLQSAPSFSPDAWPNLDDPAWSASADTYWRKAVRAAIAAHPGAPVDSTERQRGRRTRDGNGGY